MNVWDILILILVALLLIPGIRSLASGGRKRRSSCCGDCSCCAGGAPCHSAQKPRSEKDVS